MIIPFKRKKNPIVIVDKAITVSCISASVACLAVNAFVICCVLLMGGC